MADKKKKSDANLTKAELKVKAKENKKRSRQVAANNASKNGGLKEYFKGVKVETKKVVWPTRKELISYTLVVLFACAFFGLFLWGVDTAFLAALKAVFNISI